MRVTKEVPSTATETVDVICNRCGKSCKNAEGDVSATPVEVYGHYGSQRFEDCHCYKFDLCEECAFELARSFTISPEIRCVGPWADGDAAPEVTWEDTLTRNPPDGSKTV